MKIRFWTSTQYSGFMEGLIRELNSKGMDAQQCYHITEASYRSAKTAPARIWLRFRQYIAYPLQLILTLTWQRVRNGNDGSLQVVSTNTFYAPLLATYLQANTIHLVYDLFPEAMIHSGKWKEGSFKVKVIRWITRQSLQRARCNVFLGQRLKDYVESIHGSVSNSAIIEVGADQALFPQSPEQRDKQNERRTANVQHSTSNPDTPLPKERASQSPNLPFSHTQSDPPSNLSTFNLQLERSDSPTLLYCGNFGNMHDSQTLFDYWRTHAKEGTNDSCILPIFKFHCSGPKRAALEQVHAQLPAPLQARIQLGDGLNQSEWITAMERADVALVTMCPGSETVVMPSKTYSAMMAGQAILAIAPEDSDLVDLIQTANCGWWITPGDNKSLTSIIEQISSDPIMLLQKRSNAYHYAQQHLGQNALIEKWEKLGAELNLVSQHAAL